MLLLSVLIIIGLPALSLIKLPALSFLYITSLIFLLLSALIAGSFHIVISPAKILATVVDDKYSCLFPGRLCITAIGAATIGMWITDDFFVDAVCAESENQKSPMPLSDAVFPAPEPPAV